jgi:hypothetical protein
MKDILNPISTLALVSVAFPFGVNAATVTYTDSSTYSVVEFTDHMAALTLPKFDSSLGELTGVSITLSILSDTFVVSADNDNAVSTNVDAYTRNTGVSISSSLGSTSLLDNNFVSIVDAATLQWTLSQNLSLGATSGDAIGSYNNTAQGDHATWTSGSISRTTGGGNVNSMFTNSYVGSGNFSLTVTGNVQSGITSTSGVSSSMTSPTMMAVANVTYSYSPSASPIPEPSAYTSVLGICSLVGVVGLRRRSR